jgi:hypothetical protein
VSRRYTWGLRAIPAAVLAPVLGATTALAAATWTVRPGGAISAKSGKFVLRDTTTGAAPNCPSSSFTGTLAGGSGLPGTGIGSVKTAAFTLCGSPLGLRIIIQARDLPWHLNVSSYNATTGAVRGSLSHLRLTLSFSSCTAVIDGTSAAAGDGMARFRYTNGTGVLRLTGGGNLHFYNVRGCAGLLNTGDSAAVSATYPVAPRQTITSP